jgi:aspartyl-tRNA(Asn)/glutamyl-tRNA(Gln) amidotransferase subunit B
MIAKRKLPFHNAKKEEAKDYRYFPEPDIPPLRFSDDYIQKIKSSLPKLPEEIKSELIKLGIDAKFAEIIHKDKDLMSLIEKYKNDTEVKISKLASLLVNKKIDLSSDIKASYLKLNQTGETDEIKIKETINLVLKANPGAVTDYKNGKTNVTGFLVGLVMRQSAGKADPQTVNNLLAQVLASL